VLHAIDILSTEINRNMGLLGINTLAEMRPELLFRLKGEKHALYPSSIGAEHATT
jgi:isopentenyl diphosphate isomerase/L-lactate dehydrogenase-like FMN-dependent dehydrogenase